MGLAGSKILGLCCPILRLCWSSLGLVGPPWRYVGPSCGLGWPILRPMLTHVEPKDPKNGNGKRTLWNAGYFDGRRPILGLCWPILELCWPILGLCWPILGARLHRLEVIWAHLGAMLAHLGAMLAHLGAMLTHLEAYVGPSWGLCWPMLTHLKPQDPKNGKKREEQNTL